MNLAVLIPAILTYVRAKGGYTTKTKLLKLLYLLDIEAFREQRSTLTGFRWNFYKYGPWTPEYDDKLDELRRSGLIELRTGDKPELDTVFLDSVENVELSRAFPVFVEELRARRIIECWADRPTGELLDYVYFHTAPMREARRGDALDFNTVLAEEPAPEYERTSSKIPDGERKKKQREFQRLIKVASKQNPEPLFIEPRYDAEFWKAVETLDRDPD
jgi:Protein of unknown function (DUF4065)